MRDEPDPFGTRVLPSWQDVVRWLTVFALTLVGAATLIGNRIHAAGNDAVFTQGLVDRAARFGGTYYQNGITPKGPLEDVAHDLAHRIGGYNGHWYVMSVLVALSAALIAAAAARTALGTGGNRHVALAVAAVVFVHFTLADSAYAGLLYSRNILVTLLAVAWLLTIDDRGWNAPPRVQLAVAIGTGALLGLGVQTILPSFVDASAIGIAALVLLAARVDDPRRRTHLRRVIVISAVAGFLSAPAWYLLRGSFREFWASWWTYASDQSSGIGLSFGQQLSRGWHNAYSYYQHRPLLFLMIAAFVLLTVTEWPRLDRRTRVMHLALLGWLAGGWFQLVTGERYSTHYFSVIAAPTAMIGAAIAGHAFAAVSTWPRLSRTTATWPLLAVLLSCYLSAGTAARLIDASSITSSFTSAKRGTELARANQPGPNRSVQEVLDLVSRDLDPLLLYSDNQFLYNDYRRIPATRFQQRYFLIGSIYLGRTSPAYILHDTWKWFRDDLRQANPAAFIQTDPVDSKPFARFVASHFHTAFVGSVGTVELRNDIARSVLRGAATQTWAAPSGPPSGAGWTLRGNTADFEQGTTATTDDRLILATRGCQRVSGTLVDQAGTAPGVVLHVADATGHAAEMKLVITGSHVSTQDSGGGELETIPTGGSDTGTVPFSLVIGRDAAALVMNDRIVGAVAVPQHVEISLEASQPQLSVDALRVGPPSIGSGC